MIVCRSVVVKSIEVYIKFKFSLLDNWTWFLRTKPLTKHGPPVGFEPETLLCGTSANHLSVDD